LLDWRLAVDLLDLVRGRPLDVYRQRDRDFNAAQAFADDFKFEMLEGEVPVIAGRGGAELGTLHPFEDLSPESECARVLKVRSEHPRAHLRSTFDLLRRPGSLLGELTQ
jgi:hypothetical protein